MASLAIAFSLSHSLASAQSTFAADGSFSVDADKVSANPSGPKSGNFTIAPTVGAATGSAMWTSPHRYEPQASVEASSLGGGHFGGAVTAWESYSSHAPMQTSLKLVFADSIVNTSSTAQAASFKLGISSLQFMFDYGAREGVNRMSFSAKVYVDGSNNPLWSSTFNYDNSASSYDSPSSGSYVADRKSVV